MKNQKTHVHCCWLVMDFHGFPTVPETLCPEQVDLPSILHETHGKRSELWLQWGAQGAFCPARGRPKTNRLRVQLPPLPGPERAKACGAEA